MNGSRNFFSPVFLVAVVLLVAAILGLDRGIAAIVESTAKSAIEPRRSIRDFDCGPLPSFRHAPESELPPLTADDDIGTDEAILLPVVATTGPAAGYFYTLLLSYYSDPRDTIPHTPEVCYRQGGATINGDATRTVETPELAPFDIDTIPARHLDITINGRDQIVVYVINAEGKLCPGREEARLVVAFPGRKRTYFSKVEVGAAADGGTGLSREAIEAGAELLLREALAELFTNYFPTADQLQTKDG